MITGDHPGTAQAIGRQLGLLGADEVAVAGAELSAIASTRIPRPASASTSASTAPASSAPPPAREVHRRRTASGAPFTRSLRVPSGHRCSVAMY
jgi:hypothetical protein